MHGAWHGGWCWERLVPELERRGHGALALDLPSDDPTAGCARYAETVLEAVAGRDDELVLVGHSLGGLTIPLVAVQRPVRRLVFLCALLPLPGRSLADQLHTDPAFRAGFPAVVRDELERSYWPTAEAAITALYHDCDPETSAWAASRLRRQARLPSTETTPLQAWPDVEASYLLGRADPAVRPEWARRTARERLGVEPVELEGGHSPFLARPAELADALTAGLYY